MESTKCQQCQKKYIKGSWNSKYCSEECRKDFLAKRTRAQTLHRQKEGELWKTVKQAAPVVVKVPAARPVKRKLKISLILPDPQFGYRRIGNKLDPFHDESALRLARLIAEYLRPDEVIWLGDVLDLAPYGKYKQEPGFIDTVQPAIDRTYKELAIYKEFCKKQVFINGNHDARLRNFIQDNASAAASIYAAAINDETRDPVFSVQNLLRFKELEIEHIDSYPMGYYWINPELACIHGHVVRGAGQTAAALAIQNHHSTIFGHIHRIETSHCTKHTPRGPVLHQAHSPGTLARVDNTVPGVHTSLDSAGNPARYWQNWQQGVSVVYSNDSKYWLQNIQFKDGEAFFDGKIFN